MRQQIRKSVPTAGVHKWWLVGWSYIMPDFDTPDHSIIAWMSDKPPVEPDDPDAEQLAAAVVEDMARSA